MRKTTIRRAACGFWLGLLLSAGCAPMSQTPPVAAVAHREIPPPAVTPGDRQDDKGASAAAGSEVTGQPEPATMGEPAPAPKSEPPPPLPAAANRPTPPVYRYQSDTDKPLSAETLLSQICKEVAGKVYYKLKRAGERDLSSRVAVVAAVPLSDLKRESEFGRLVGEELLTDLADRGLKVIELRLGREINILPQTGEFILSRNIGELANDMPTLDYVMVSTFTNTRRTLILQGRLVSLKTGVVESSWRYNLPLNSELLGLFHEPEQPFTIAVKGMRR